MKSQIFATAALCSIALFNQASAQFIARDTNRDGAIDWQDTQYFRSDQYLDLTKEEKLDQLWGACVSDPTMAEIQWEKFPTFLTSRMGRSFGSSSDEMPPDRIKVNHAQGVVAQVEYVDNQNHPYTGMFSGNKIGILRLSEGNFIVEGMTGLTPTMALKFLRDGVPSGNLLANVSFEPTNSFNFLDADFNTRISGFENEDCKDTVMAKFLEQNNRPHSLGLSEFASIDETGTPVTNPELPFNLYFRPNADIAARFADGERDDSLTWQEQMASIENEAELFTVMAFETPESANAVTIGSIKLKTQLQTSRFGDERLFFSHQGMRQDFQIHSEWSPHVERHQGLTWEEKGLDDQSSWVPTDRAQAQEFLEDQIQTYGCPFAWALGKL